MARLYLIAILGAALCVAAGPACDSCVVISQVYGGGGNNGSDWTNDFVELFNRGGEPVDLSGWSVQYSAAGGASWTRTLLSGVIEPGQYFLVQEARGNRGTRTLPPSDAQGSIAIASASGKLALVASRRTLVGASPGREQDVVDMVGFGSAHAFRGSGPAPAPGNLAAIVRGGFGCFDTGNNASDFTVTGTIVPRNSSSPARPCPGLLAIRNQPALPAARQQTAYAAAFDAAGGSGGGYRFQLESGSLPPGMALTGELLHGTPVSAAASPYSFTLRVTDSLGNTATKEFHLPVAPERAAVTVASR